MPGKLSRQQNADAIAFILKGNGWPAGPTELATDLATLRQIRIVAVRPDPGVSGDAAAPRP
jgi:hypothetical protein